MAKQVERPTSLTMDIHSGVLESLGINMYTSIAKSLVEFVANAFDADATRVDIEIPFADIEKERKKNRNNGSSDMNEQFNAEFKVLSPKLEIKISDNGHGMLVEEIQDKFLPINRHRRDEPGGDKSETFKRTVMGRKGLGKLAGFGAATKVRIKSKRKGETYATVVDMDYAEIKKCEILGQVSFSPEYIDDLPAEDTGTEIILSCLRGDSVKASENTVRSIIARNFSISGENFEIFMNRELVEAEQVSYEFIHPNKDGSLAEVEVEVHEGFTYPILYSVKFRERDGRHRALPANQRGARIYCNGRLAAGPTLLNLQTGMHNFHSQSYMECIVYADVLDQQEIDLIGTNRAGIKSNNSIVGEFEKKVTELMRVALWEHSKFRDGVIEQRLENDPASKQMLNMINFLAAPHREPAKRLLKILAANEGIDSEIYVEAAPMLIKAVNSHEVLVDLIKTGRDPKDLSSVIEQLKELAEIERSDVLKLYRGRRSAIMGLEKLQDQARMSSKRDEAGLHNLLKDNPWLVDSEYERFITSDRSESTVAIELTKELKIDTEVGTEVGGDRPDLVFVITDPTTQHHVCIVELKAPSKPMAYEDLAQLEGYIANIEDWLARNGKDAAKISGILIGNMTDSTDKTLRKRIKDAGPNSQWKVISIPELIEKARRTHLESINALEAEEQKFTKGGEVNS